MTKAAEGNPSSVQRSADGRAISHRWILGIAQTLAGMPGAVEEGKLVPLTRGQVRVTHGGYACLGGPCGHGCGAPDVGESMRIQCIILHMALGSMAREVRGTGFAGET